MKSVPSIAYLACCLAPSITNAFAPTPDLRIRQFTPTDECIIASNDSAAQTSSSAVGAAAATTTALPAHGQYGNGRSSSRYASAQDRTKRQERVGHVVRAELATILHRGTSIKNDNEPIESELRRRINIVHCDVSPDLRQARVTVSIMAVPRNRRGDNGGDGDNGDGDGGRSNHRRGDDTVAKRRAYAWLVRNTKAIRHACAQKMAHMKGGSPDLTFVQVDVGAAVDVMQLIEKVSEGYKRQDVLEMGFEEEWEEGDDEDDGWFDFDEDGDGISVEVEV